MDFDLSEDQRLLKESVDRLIADQYQFEHRKKYASDPVGYSPETAIVMEAFGRGLVLEPYFATVILGGGLLRRAASTSVIGALAPKVAAGKLKLEPFAVMVVSW